MQQVDDIFKKDKEIVIEAIKQDKDALECADKSLWNDPDILAVVNKKKYYTLLVKYIIQIYFQ